jgi:hypothetical protein
METQTAIVLVSRRLRIAIRSSIDNVVTVNWVDPEYENMIDNQ